MRDPGIVAVYRQGSNFVQHCVGGISLVDRTRLENGGRVKVNFGAAFPHDDIRHGANLTEHGEHLWHTSPNMWDVKNRLRETMKGVIQALGAENKA